MDGAKGELVAERNFLVDRDADLLALIGNGNHTSRLDIFDNRADVVGRFHDDDPEFAHDLLQSGYMVGPMRLIAKSLNPSTSALVNLPEATSSIS